MSTYMYLKCLNHDPPLFSDEEVGQHTYDLERIQKEVRVRHLFEQMAVWGIYPDYRNHFTNNAIRFLLQHSKCGIGIEDEYGREYPLEGERDES